MEIEMKKLTRRMITLEPARYTTLTGDVSKAVTGEVKSLDGSNMSEFYISSSDGMHFGYCTAGSQIPYASADNIESVINKMIAWRNIPTTWI